MFDNGPRSGVEYWTRDAQGHGYCSTTSLEDAVRNHIWEMNNCINPHGGIVDIKIVTREVIENVDTVMLSEVNKRN